MINIQQTSEKFLETIFSKTQGDFGNRIDENIIGALLGLDFTKTKTITTYLEQKNLIQNDKFSGNSIQLTASGIDQVTEIRKNKIFKKIKFTYYRYLQSSRDAIEFAYIYEIIDGNNPEIRSDQKLIKVGISGSAALSWQVNIWSGNPRRDYAKVEKILFLYGIDKIAEKLNEGTLESEEDLLLLSNSDLTKYGLHTFIHFDIQGFEVEIEIGEKELYKEIEENVLAAGIIEDRDTINSIFYEKHSEKLLLLNEERNLLDFFKKAKTEEEFSHRLASLGQVSRNLNVHILRKLTNEINTQLGSVILLGSLLTNLGYENNSIIDTLKHIGRIRQGYPIHTDVTGIIKSCQYFGINYPIEDYELTWNILLNNYHKALRDLKNIFIDKYL